jgi:hypothetical protein
MNRTDWTLLALAAANGQPLSPVQLQKSLFLLERHFPAALGGESYSFTPHDYGPFSQAAHADVEGLSQAGLAQVSTAREGWMQ